MQSENTQQMRRIIERFIETLAREDEGKINRMMAYTLVDCDYEKMTLTYAFEVCDWMLNPAGSMHGGILATAFDIAFGSLSVILSDLKRCPTISLNCNFVRPIMAGDTLIVTANCVSAGKSVCHHIGTAISKNSGKVIGTATGEFFSGGNAKSRYALD